MKEEQFDKFWEVKCPKCNNCFDIEILINKMEAKIEKKCSA